MKKSDLLKIDDIQFELFCKKILEYNGFHVLTTPVTGDGGIDLIAQCDKTFFKGTYLVQCKRYSGSVGPNVVQQMIGVIESRNNEWNANKGIIMISSRFTDGARMAAQNNRIELIDGDDIVRLVNNEKLDIDEFINSRKEIGNVPFFEVNETENQEKVKTLIDIMSINKRDYRTFKELAFVLNKALFADVEILKLNHSLDSIIVSKKNTAKLFLDEAGKFLKANKQTDELITVIMLGAQSAFLCSEWDIAIKYYKMALVELEQKKKSSKQRPMPDMKKTVDLLNVLKTCVISNIYLAYRLLNLESHVSYIVNKIENEDIRKKIINQNKFYFVKSGENSSFYYPSENELLVYDVQWWNDMTIAITESTDIIDCIILSTEERANLIRRISKE